MNKKLLLIALCSAWFSSAAEAAVYYVKTGGLDTNDCSDWAKACKTISKGVSKLTVDGDVLRVSKGKYTLTTQVVLPSLGVSIVGGFDDGAEVGYGSTVLSGNSGNNDTGVQTTAGELKGVTLNSDSGLNPTENFRAFSISNNAELINLENLIFTGFNTSGCGTYCNGAALSISNGKVNLSNVRFQGNKEGNWGVVFLTGESILIGTNVKFFNNTAVNGGAIGFWQTDLTTFTCEFCTFEGNKATSKGGVAYSYYDEGAAVNQGIKRFTLENSSLKNNSSTEGGALAFNEAARVELVDTDFIGNSTTGDGGAIYANQSSMYLDGVTFKDNVANVSGKSGAAIYLKLSNSQDMVLSIKNSEFENNDSGAFGAISYWQDGGAQALIMDVENSTFLNNDTAWVGGAIVFGGAGNKSILNVVNSTFSNNTAGDWGGAIGLYDSAIANISYSTFVKNQSGTGGAIGVTDQLPTSSTDPELSLAANLFFENTATRADGSGNFGSMASRQSSALGVNSKIKDKGFNVFGLATTGHEIAPYPMGTLNLLNTSSFSSVATNIDQIFDPVNIAENGGKVKTYRLLEGNAELRDVIPDEAIPFVGVGKSVEYPFTSLSQAHGALRKFKEYSAGYYYFDIGGSYASAAENFAYTPGLIQFSTYVDDDGWVLVASSNSYEKVPGAYQEVLSLQRRSDNILVRAVLQHFTANQIDQVRISSQSGGDRGTFDGYSVDADVIQALSQFKTLPNPGTNPAGTWVVTESSTGNNYFKGAYVTADQTLAQEIYHAGGEAGIHWIPVRPNEALLYPGGANTFADSLDLWVRGNKGLCDGSVTATDGRSLPRSDYVNPNDPNQYGEVHNCDIGAFEFNNGYQMDCVEEDGMRPVYAFGENKASVSFCFYPDNTITPKALLNNIGAVDKLYLILLGIAGLVLRMKRRYH